MVEQPTDPRLSEDVPDEVTARDEVEEADRESFPARDPPSRWAGTLARYPRQPNPA
jgi:hypothetical protein